MTMELIKVTTDAQGEQLVSGRELHEFLEVTTPYRKWFPRMVEYGFLSNVDYTPDIFVHPLNGQETIDHAMKLDMAKEISMIQRTPKGKQARQYFIEVEKQFKQQAPNIGSLEGVVTSVISYIKDAVLAEVRQDITRMTEQEFTTKETPANEPVYLEAKSSDVAAQLGYSGEGRKGANQLHKALEAIGVLEKARDDYGNSCWTVSERWAENNLVVKTLYQGKRPWLRWTPEGVSLIKQLADMGVLKVA